MLILKGNYEVLDYFIYRRVDLKQSTRSASHPRIFRLFMNKLIFNLQKCIDFSDVHPKTTCFAVKLYISPHENGFVNKA